MEKTEHRAALEIRLTPEGRLSGTVVRYGEQATIGRFTEEFAPGSLDASDVVANVQHDRNRPIGRTGDGGLAFEDAADALRLSLDFLETRDAQDARELVRRGVLRGLSMEFRSIKDRWQGRHRIVEKAVLTGVALVARPAYAGSTVDDLRSEPTPPADRRRLRRYG